MLYATDSTAPALSSITFSGVPSVSAVSSVSDGGAFYIDHGNMDFSIPAAVAFSNIHSTSGRGGVFYFARVNNVVLTSNSFTSVSSALSGSVLYSSSTTLVLTLTSNQINCLNSPWTTGILATSIGIPVPTNTIGGAVYILNAVATVTSTTNTYQNCYTGDVGGAISLINSKLAETSSTY
jgi:hypothetical protein